MKEKLTREEKIEMAVIMTTAALEALNIKIETSITEKEIVKKLRQNCTIQEGILTKDEKLAIAAIVTAVVVKIVKENNLQRIVKLKKVFPKPH